MDAALTTAASHERDCTDALRERVRETATRRAALVIRGSGSKTFLGNPCAGEMLDLHEHTGVIAYEPGELVITARAGTRLTDIEASLAERGQMLAFEPPHFGTDATLGGTIACGLSGPGRANAGAARDFVLGVRVLDGCGNVLRFGGEVIKNVAGYDLSRLMVGAFGTLGVLLDVSLKVLPRARAEETRVIELDAAEAVRRVREWSARPLPLTASAIFDGRLYVRLSGAESAVRAACVAVGGDAPSDTDLWKALREQTLAFFADPRPLWRLSIAPASAVVDCGGPQLIEWHGAQRWVKTDAPAATLRAIATAHGGHATLFRSANLASAAHVRFHPLPPALLALQRRLKAELDPFGIFNRGRLYPDL